jgi:pimeloyl-ACP methyl ester carboxylesterase
MRLSVGSLPVDVTRAESARFRRPLLFVHGLWTGSWIWHGFMAYLAHRGWESWAPSFLEGGVADDDRVMLLREVARAMPAPPVIVAHDVGAVIATTIAPSVQAPAVVAIAPTSPGPGSIDRWPRYWSARWFGSRVEPPRDAAASVVVAEAADRLRPDSGPFFRALVSRSLAMPAASVRTGLVVCAPQDPLSPVARGLSVARNYGWSFEEWSTPGHAPMLAEGWEALADRVHRWLVLSLGEELLAWLDDDADPE